MLDPKAEVWSKIKQNKKIKPLGNTSPLAWAIEPTHGCNLRCWHCSCRLDKPGDYHFMSEETWRAAFQVMNEVTPTCRVDLCLGGEPSLHPRLYEFLRIARELCPGAQIQMTTNGTMLMKGVLTYRALFEAGINIVYTDMYGPREKFRQLAIQSDMPWYEYYDAPEGAPSPWTYHGPHLQVIVLQEQPSNWPKSRRRAGLLGTWYNNLDWKAAARFGITRVTTPPARRCNQPFIYVPVHYNGSYLLCCQDNTGETAGQYGSVLEGAEGFRRYWFGERVQTIRRRLREKNRADSPQCSRCSITFSRCDYKLWTDEQVGKFWDGSKWQEMLKAPKALYRFANAISTSSRKKKTNNPFPILP